MARTFFQIGSIAALLAVALGAFAAHGLQNKIAPDQITIFQTGVRYQFYHAFGILIAALLLLKRKNIWLQRAGWSFVLGIVLFSGSLYLLSCREWLHITNWKWLGPLTPIGGIFFIFGWASFFFATLKSNFYEKI